MPKNKNVDPDEPIEEEDDEGIISSDDVLDDDSNDSSDDGSGQYDSREREGSSSDSAQSMETLLTSLREKLEELEKQNEELKHIIASRNATGITGAGNFGTGIPGFNEQGYGSESETFYDKLDKPISEFKKEVRDEVIKDVLEMQASSYKDAAVKAFKGKVGGVVPNEIQQKYIDLIMKAPATEVAELITNPNLVENIAAMAIGESVIKGKAIPNPPRTRQEPAGGYSFEPGFDREEKEFAEWISNATGRKISISEARKFLEKGAKK